MSDFRGELCKEKIGKLGQYGYEHTRNSGPFVTKQVLFGALKNYDFW